METTSTTNSSSGAAAVAGTTTRWALDPAHTNAQFTVRHMMIASVRGRFGKVSGTVKLDGADPRRSNVEVTIDAASLDTGEAARDTHLRSADFFDVEKFPQITFKSTKVQEGAGGELKVTGDLTIRGVTKPIVLTVEPLGPVVKSPWGQTVRGVSASAAVNRKEWALVWNTPLEAGGVLVGDNVQIQIDAEMVQTA